jgi:hypothetical protein
MWPCVGLTPVTVPGGTSVAPVSVSTTCSVGPVTTWPWVGDTMVITAVVDGLAGRVADGDVATATEGVLEQPAANAHTAMATATRPNLGREPPSRGCLRAEEWSGDGIMA